MIGKPTQLIDCDSDGCYKQEEFTLEPFTWRSSLNFHWSSENIYDFLKSKNWTQNKDGQWWCPDHKE